MEQRFCLKCPHEGARGPISRVVIKRKMFFIGRTQDSDISFTFINDLRTFSHS